MMLNMKTGRRSYDPDFKKAIVDKVLQDGFSATAVANEHELNPGTVQRWVALARAGKPLCAQEAKREEALRQKQLSDAEKARNYDNVVSERDQAVQIIHKPTPLIAAVKTHNVISNLSCLIGHLFRQTH